MFFKKIVSYKKSAILLTLLAIIVFSGLLTFNYFKHRKAKITILPKKQNFVGNINNCLNKYFSARTIDPDTDKELTHDNFVIKLKSRHFLPEKNQKNALKCLRFLPEGRSYYAIVQFFSVITSEDKELLFKHGIYQKGYLPENSFFTAFTSKLNDQAIEELLSRIRWVGEVLPQDKVPVDIWEKGGYVEAEDGNGHIYIVLFFEGTTQEEARVVAEKYGNIISEISSNEFRTKLKISMKKENVRKLAEENSVSWIEAYAKPVLH